MDGSAQWRSSITSTVGAFAASAARNAVHAANDSSRLAAARPSASTRPSSGASRARNRSMSSARSASERRCVSSLDAASSRSSERFTPVASRTTSSSGANVTDSP